MSPANTQNLEQMTPDEFMQALAKLKRLSRRQKAGKTIGYVTVKSNRLKNNLPEDSTRLQSGFGEEEQPEPSLAERVGLGGKSIDQMSKEEKQAVKDQLANPENLARLFRGNQGDPNLGRQNEDGTLNYINPETGFYQKEKPQMSPIRQLDRVAGQNIAYDEEGNEIKRTSYDPYHERQIEKGQKLGRYNEDGTPNYINPKTGDYQRDDPSKPGGEGEKESWKDKSKAFGTKLAGKAAGKVIGAIAEQGGPISAVLIYGLALANDFPDLLNPIIEWLSIFSWSFVDFLFDVIIFLGFRYFLRDHINVPGVKVALYVCALAEILPIPIIDHIDIFPFWTLCAWLALRKINQEKAIQAQTGGSREDAARQRQLGLEREYAGYNQ